MIEEKTVSNAHEAHSDFQHFRSQNISIPRDEFGRVLCYFPVPLNYRYRQIWCVMDGTLPIGAGFWSETNLELWHGTLGAMTTFGPVVSGDLVVNLPIRYCDNLSATIQHFNRCKSLSAAGQGMCVQGPCISMFINTFGQPTSGRTFMLMATCNIMVLRMRGYFGAGVFTIGAHLQCISSTHPPYPYYRQDFHTLA